MADGDEPAHRLGPARRDPRPGGARDRPLHAHARRAPRRPRRTCAHYDAETRRLLDAYAAGVNAFLADAPGAAAGILAAAASRPSRGARSTRSCWTKVMAWDLGGNWRSELLRMRLSQTLPLERIQEFLPPYPGDAAPQIPDLKALYSGMEKKLAPDSRVLATRIPMRCRLEQLGGVRRAQRERQAAARQRSAPRPDRAAGLVLRAPARAGHGRDRRHAARRARRSSSAATSASPGASPTPAPTCRTCISRSSTRRFTRARGGRSR